MTNIAANFNYLNNMACNTTVHIQVLTPTQAIRLKTRLIGVDPKMSVILAINHDDDWHKAKHLLRENQRVIVRLVNSASPEANIIAFRTVVQKVMSITGNWLVLNYPKHLQKVSLRKHSRINIHVNCLIIDKETELELSNGYLQDISIDGCAFIGKLPSNSTIGSEYNLQVKLDATEASLIIPMTVKNCIENEKRDNQQYGLTFKEKCQDTEDFVVKILTHHLSLSSTKKTTDESN